MTRLAILLVATCADALPAMAETGGRGARMFQLLDADADGQVTMAELTAGKTEMFAAADANADGLLNAEERALMREAARQRAAANGVPGDADGDGNISLAEFTGTNPLFDRADADGDDIVTRAEFDTFRGQHRP